MIACSPGAQDMAYTIGIDLIGILGTLVAFLAFFAALRFSRNDWPYSFLTVFKVVVAVTSVAALVSGTASLALLVASGLGGALAAYYGLWIAIAFAVVCMLTAIAAIFYLSVKEG